MLSLDDQHMMADIERLLSALNISAKACKVAAQRAIRKTARSTQSHVTKALANELRIQQKLLRSRLKMYLQGDGMQQKIWLGLNAIAAKRLGTPKRHGTGTRVGQHFFAGAFPIWKYGGGVYRRTTMSRFPLELAKLEVDQVGKQAFKKAAKASEDRLLHFFMQELNFELQKIK